MADTGILHQGERDTTTVSSAISGTEAKMAQATSLSDGFVESTRIHIKSHAYQELVNEP
jgi:hypothetical protein